jgi:hypothetical protein
VRSLLGLLGGIFRRDISYLGTVGLFTPIWDVLAPEGKQEGALNCLATRSRSPAFLIRQAVPVGLPQAHFCCWARWARFFMVKKLYYGRYSVFTYNLPLYKCLGRREWVNGVGWVWMTLSKLGKCSPLGLSGLGFPPGLAELGFFMVDTMNIYPLNLSQIFNCHCFMARVPHMDHTSINK